MLKYVFLTSGSHVLRRMKYEEERLLFYFRSVSYLYEDF